MIICRFRRNLSYGFFLIEFIVYCWVVFLPSWTELFQRGFSRIPFYVAIAHPSRVGMPLSRPRRKTLTFLGHSFLLPLNSGNNFFAAFLAAAARAALKRRFHEVVSRTKACDSAKRWARLCRAIRENPRWNNSVHEAKDTTQQYTMNSIRKKP